MEESESGVRYDEFFIERWVIIHPLNRHWWQVEQHAIELVNTKLIVREQRAYAFQRISAIVLDQLLSYP